MVWRSPDGGGLTGQRAGAGWGGKPDLLRDFTDRVDLSKQEPSFFPSAVDVRGRELGPEPAVLLLRMAQFDGAI